MCCNQKHTLALGSKISRKYKQVTTGIQRLKIGIFGWRIQMVILVFLHCYILLAILVLLRDIVELLRLQLEVVNFGFDVDFGTPRIRRTLTRRQG